MYSVSNAYLEAMRQPVMTWDLYGTIDDINFNTSNILSGSFQITNQCCDTNKLALGGVFVGELDCTFMNVDIARGNWIGKTITPYCGLWTGSEFEYVPLGIFTISEATWNSDKTVDVVAYDYMEKFDKKIPETSTFGTPYNLALLACDSCNVTLGMTENDFSDFVNGTETLTLYTENNDLDTWRDFLYWLAQSIGCFCTISRDGKLVFRPFNQTIVETIEHTRRYEGFDFSEYVTKYTGLSVVNMDDDTTSYYGIDGSDNDDAVDDGSTMDLGENPFMQIADQETRDLQRRNILDALTLMTYGPFKGRIAPNPIWDLGDIIKFTDGYGDDNLHCIMQYSFTYERATTVQGWGDNPALANAKSKTDKNISGLRSRVDSGGSQDDVMHYYYYTNASKIKAGAGVKKECVRLYYSAKKSTYAVMHAEIRIKTTYGTTPIENQNRSNEIAFPLTKLKFSYKLNGEEDTLCYPKETLLDGDHTLHLLYPMRVTEVGLHALQVYLESTDGGFEIDKDDLDVVLFGEGLEGEGVFDGLLTITEEFSNVLIPDSNEVLPWTTNAVATTRIDNINTATDIFTNLVPDTNTMDGSWSSTLAPRIPRETYLISTVDKLKYEYDDTKVLTTNDEFSLANSVSTASIISDSFNLYNALITGIESTTVQYSGTPTISISIDEGETWYAFDGYSWERLSGNEGMQVSTFIAITIDQWAALTHNRGTITTKITLHTGDTLKSILYDFTN